MKAYVIGNGPDLSPTLLESLDAPAFAVNRIWKIFDRTTWRPAYYVRSEVPAYDPDHVREDLEQMGKVGCVMYLQDGFRGLEPKNPHPATRYEFFRTCDGSPHNWHMPLICGYGTVVQVAIQIAVKDGFDEIHIIGCGGEGHFYDEPFHNADLATKANEIARLCSPVRLIWHRNEST